MSTSEQAFKFDDPDDRLGDPDRLRRLDETGLTGVRDDPALDRLTSLAGEITGQGVALICLLESTRQTFPSIHGLSGPVEAARQMPVSHSFSQYVVANGEPLVVTDAREHPFLRHNPSVEEYGVIAYAGYPLRDPDGVVLGTLCLSESTPREWSVKQLDMLRVLAASVETEIALRLQTRRAQLCEQQMRHVIESVADVAVLAADFNGVVTVMNEGAEKLFALRADNVIGLWSLSDVLRSSEPLGPPPGEGQAQDWLVVDGARRTKVLSIRSRVLRDSWGGLGGYILVASDVSDRRETETLLRDALRNQREAIERLTDLDRLRSVFIATASHELRTPVSSILGYTELLIDGAAGALSPAQLKLVSRVDDNSTRLLALVEELLDLSRLESKKPMVSAPMDVNSPAERAWAALQPHLTGRGLQAHLERSDASPQIVGDAAQVERALLHLLQNAVKFTLAGGTIRLTVRASSNGVEYEIADTGIGISDADRASVFDPFFRTQHAHSLAIPGVGIGLSIVRRIVEAHQGQVHFTSQSGSGTTFTLTLPIMKPEESLPAPGHGTLVAEELQEHQTLRRGLEAELKLALEGRASQFSLYYQPIVDLNSGRVVAVESQLQWQHPVRGLLGPAQVIPLAEATGLIHRLGDWALDEAVRDAASLTCGGHELDIAVNLSILQLDDQLVVKVRSALESSGLSPERLVLEVTERAFVEDVKTTAATYEALSQLGVKIVIDDFGTGYSSLVHLRRNPIDALKIGSELVAGIGQSADDEAICESIVSLAGAVGASTAGDGIETEAQYAVLRLLGCARGQGFLWSPAVPIHELDAAFAACDAIPVVAPQSRMPRAPEIVPPEVMATIAEMHAEGASRHTIAAALNRTVGRHPNGVRWTAGTVGRQLPTEAASMTGPPTAPKPWP